MNDPAGWYPDPHNPKIDRFWDGQQWSQQTRAHTIRLTPLSPDLRNTAPEETSSPVKVVAGRLGRVVAAIVAGFFVLVMLGGLFDGEFGVAALFAGFALPLIWIGFITPFRRRQARKRGAIPSAMPAVVNWGLAIGAVALIVIGVATDSAPPAESNGAVEQSADLTRRGSAAESASAPASSSSSPSSIQNPIAKRDVEFSEDMVRAHGVTKEDKGGQSNVRFVGATDDPVLLETLTQQCIDHFLQQRSAAYCYAYGSDVDYDYKTFDWTIEFDESVYGGSRPCWVYYSGQPLSGRAERNSDPKSGMEYVREGCPGTVDFPDEDGSLAAERARQADVEASANARRPRDPCALVDADALTRFGFVPVLGDVTGDPTSYLPDGATATYNCQNAELELGFVVTAFSDDSGAVDSVNSETPQPGNFLLESDGFVIDIPGGWALINETLGISTARWSVGNHGFDVTLNSMPVVSGTDIGQPASDLSATIQGLVMTATDRLLSDNW